MLSESKIAILISLASVLISVYFGWYRIKKERPILKHEVVSCKHKVTQDGGSTDLELVFKLHNRGDRGTQLNRIEAYATDFSGEEHQSSYDLSRVEYLKEASSTKEIKASFCFSPYFEYKEKMPCRFIVYHTTGEYSFEHESEESDDYLGVQVSSAKVPW